MMGAVERIVCRLLLALLLLGSSAQAQSSCENAEAISLPFEHNGEYGDDEGEYNAQFTSSSCGGSRPLASASVGNGLWFSYTPSRNTIISVELTGGDGTDDLFGRNDPSMAIFEGSCDQLSCRDEEINFGLRDEFIGVDANVAYTFFVYCEWKYSQSSLGGGCPRYTMTVFEEPIPENDEIENAIIIATPYFVENFPKFGALSDLNIDACGLSKRAYGVWFQYTPPANEIVQLDLEFDIGNVPFTDYDDYFVGVQTRTSGGGLACEYAGGREVSEFQVSQGTTYYILIASGTPNYMRTFDMTFRVDQTLPTPTTAPTVRPTTASPSAKETVMAFDSPSNMPTVSSSAGMTMMLSDSPSLVSTGSLSDEPTAMLSDSPTSDAPLRIPVAPSP